MLPSAPPDSLYREPVRETISLFDDLLLFLVPRIDPLKATKIEIETGKAAKPSTANQPTHSPRLDCFGVSGFMAGGLICQ